MIPRANITAWRAHAPWATDAQVEQDLALTRAIVDIYSDPILGDALAFRGGTALHKLFLRPASRYSEDIDLVQVRAEPIGPVMDALRARLDPWLGTPKWKLGGGMVTLVYRFDTEVLPVTKMRLKVEINTREHFAVRGHHRQKVRVDNPWFVGEAEVVTFELEELLGTKLRALYQRKKGRDLFDLAKALDRYPALDRERVVQCFVAYTTRGGTPISRAEFEQNLASKAADAAFLGDVHALLATVPGFAYDAEFAFDTGAVFDGGVVDTYDATAALEVVKREFVERLPGEAWKGKS